MINPEIFIDACIAKDYSLITGTPCSYLSSLISYIIDNKFIDFIETTNEGDAVALASGTWLGGEKSVVMFQNSGLGNAINPLTSLSLNMQIPFIGIVSLRGEPGGPRDEPQHELMGKITIDLLEKMGVPWSYFPEEKDKVSAALTLADEVSQKKRTPYFFVMKKNSVEDYALKTNNASRVLNNQQSNIINLLAGEIKTSRRDVIGRIKDLLPSGTAFIATTGKTGRELCEIKDDEDNFYMVGSMGCALPIGLGLSKTKFKNRICVLDGDGALLMRLGNMALAGQMKTNSFLHILLDNGVHDSTGGQRTFSEMIDFSMIAKACGYKNIYNVDNIKMLDQAIKESSVNNELTFIRVIIKPGSDENLSRPTTKPCDVAMRMRKSIISGY